MEIIKQTSNISAKKIIPKGIVLHHTAGTYLGSVEWCLYPISAVSYHCIVNTNGDRTILAKDTQRAWHAGISKFKGRSDCNSWMLGIAVSGNTYERTLTKEEIKSVGDWCIEKMNKYKFGIDMITTHREVSPGRKYDVSPEAEKQIVKYIINNING